MNFVILGARIGRGGPSSLVDPTNTQIFKAFAKCDDGGNDDDVNKFRCGDDKMERKVNRLDLLPSIMVGIVDCNEGFSVLAI